MKFDNFHGAKDNQKALSFISSLMLPLWGNFTESSKVQKNASFFTDNALQWQCTLLIQGSAPKT